MELKFEGKRISSIRTNIMTKDFELLKDKYCALMDKLTRDFLEEQCYRGDLLLEYAKEKNIEIGDSFITFKHSKGTALINICSYSCITDIQVSAAINISGNYFISGFTFNRGNFSDVYLHIESFNTKLWFTTRDTLLEHNLYLVWVIEKLEKYIEDTSIELDYNLKTDFYMFDLKLFKFIEEEIREKININKSRRIDLLEVDGIKIKDYIKEHRILRYINSENDIFKVCLLYGKPYKQVKKYIQNH